MFTFSLLKHSLNEASVDCGIEVLPTALNHHVGCINRDIFRCFMKHQGVFAHVCAFLCVRQARQAELEAARLAKEKEEEEAKQAAQQAKKEKEIQKKAIKKERQKLRTTCKVSSQS